MELTNLVDDKFFLPRLMRLQECLCEELEKAGGPSLCFCGLVPASRPPLALMDCGKEAGCGVAWVAPVTAFPASSFPVPDEDGAFACASPMAMTVEVGIARCHPRPRRGNATLDPQDTFEAVRLYMSDMAAARRAILCCFARTPEEEYQASLTSWAPMDPEAGVSGGSWTAVIG